MAESIKVTEPVVANDGVEEGLSQEEEEKYISDNLAYIGKFLATLQGRERQLPPKSLASVKHFRDEWSVFFIEESSSSSEAPSGTRSEGQTRQRSGEATGAIPKRFGVGQRLPAKKEDFSDSDQETNPTSTEDEISFNKPTTSKRLKKMTRPSDWQSIISRLDSRKAPPMSNYNEKTGQTLTAFLTKFEEYCEETFRGSRDLWLSELESKLDGRSLEAFKSLHEIEDSYDVMKEKLLDWYEDMKEVRREKNKQDFNGARCEDGESMHLFSSRLERLFRVAYPRRKVGESKTLRDKFIDSVPKNFRKLLKSHVMSEVIKGEKIKWKMIQKCARYYDVEHEKGNKGVEAETFRVHNLQKKKDATTQSGVMHETSTLSVPPRFERPQGNQRRWNAGLPRSIPAKGDEGCRYCGRIGHYARDCRKMLGLCFICGSRDHQLRQCPRYRRYNGFSGCSQRSSSQPAREHPSAAHEPSDRRHSATARPTPLNYRAPAQLRSSRG